jgi:hypothetical protein
VVEVWIPLVLAPPGQFSVVVRSGVGWGEVKDGAVEGNDEEDADGVFVFLCRVEESVKCDVGGGEYVLFCAINDPHEEATAESCAILPSKLLGA